MSDIKPDDLFLIHREGKDYKATVDQFAKDIHINVDACCEAPNDGKLTIKDSDGATVGEFTANQAGDTDVTLPDCDCAADILNAPIVKSTKYIIWEDVEGHYRPMELIEGDGGSGSTFKSADGQDKPQTSIDGTIQYKSSMAADTESASICMAQVKSLTCVALSPDGSEGYEGVEVESTAMGGGCFHSHAIKKSSIPKNETLEYKLKLEFVNCNGDTDLLYVDSKTHKYVAMRLEDVDLREMEQLDAELKAQKQAEKEANQAAKNS